MQIKTNKDVTEYEENVFIGMTMRQTLLGFAGVAIITAAYFTTYNRMNSNLASWVAIGLGLPCFLFGFAKPHKMKLEKFLAIWFVCNFLEHRRLPFKEENKYFKACFVEEKQPNKRRIKKHVDSKEK
jgi:FtsH-binding integral membrane protein